MCCFVSIPASPRGLDEALQSQLIQELYDAWLDRQLQVFSKWVTASSPRVHSSTMTASMSSRLRLLLDSAPLSNVDPRILAEQEDSIAAWQLDVGQELAAENIPLAHVVLGGGRHLARQWPGCHGQPFTCADVSMPVSGGGSGVLCPACLLQLAAPRKPPSCW